MKATAMTSAWLAQAVSMNPHGLSAAEESEVHNGERLWLALDHLSWHLSHHRSRREFRHTGVSFLQLSYTDPSPS